MNAHKMHICRCCDAAVLLQLRPLLRLMLTAVACAQLAAAAMLCNDWTDVEHRFQAFAHCRRSNKTQLGLANYRRVERCAQFARSRRALAFNYAPINGTGHRRTERNGYDVVQSDDNPHNYTFIDARKSPDGASLQSDDEFFNCHVLACPEWSDLADILNDTRFDYYTMYANPAPPPNATCLPGIGVFIYYNRFENYTTAAATCQAPLTPNVSRAAAAAGELANVMSARRTNAIAQLVRSQRPDDARLDVAYIGLNRSSSGGGGSRSNRNAVVRTASLTADMRTSAGEPIDCFLYRAWAPGHPRVRAAVTTDRSLCVAVTRQREWRAYACTKRLPFVCEVFTSRRQRPGGVNVRQRCEGLPLTERGMVGTRAAERTHD